LEFLKFEILDNMAKTSVKARQKKREKMVAQHAVKRAELKKAGDWKALDEMPRNSSKVRLKNRCQITGRPKGYVRYFGLSRIMVRDMALNGKIPGLKKASW
jgi:small subunit ribosomal protein S14